MVGRGRSRRPNSGLRRGGAVFGDADRSATGVIELSNDECLIVENILRAQIPRAHKIALPGFG
jgi:hypothetical protein